MRPFRVGTHFPGFTGPWAESVTYGPSRTDAPLRPWRGAKILAPVALVAALVVVLITPAGISIAAAGGRMSSLSGSSGSGRPLCP